MRDRQKPSHTGGPYKVSIINRNEQEPPKGDARYRVHRSVKCYVAEMECGARWCTLYFSSSIERVVYLSPAGIEKVIYNNTYYDLRAPEEMTEMVRRHLSDKGAVHVSGKSLLHNQKEQAFDAYPFIDVTESTMYDQYRHLRERWLQSAEYKNA